MRQKITLICTLILVIITSIIIITPVRAQDASGNLTGACENVSYLMERNITPYDMSLSGGILSSGASESGTLGAGAYANFWSFSLTRPRNQNNIIQDLPVTITFSNVSGSPLEFALFNGLFPVMNYQPLIAGDFPYSPSAETSAYTLVVRKVNLADESAGNYAVTVTSDGMGTPALSLRNEQTNQDFSPAPELSNGVTRITAPAAEVFIHPDGTRRVHPRNGESTQVFMPNERFDFSAHTINIGNWANKLSFLGGDLAAVGADRVYFLERFDPRITNSGVSPIELNLQNVTYPDGTIIRTDWQIVAGIWVMEDCVGFKLKDGRTFTATTPADEREIRAEGALDNFDLTVNALTPTGSERHIGYMTWWTIRENSQITLRNGVYHFDLVADRELEFQSTDFDYFTFEVEEGKEISSASMSLNEQGITIILDWVNMRAFSLLNDLITFNFLDAPRGTTTRDGLNIERITALGDVIQLVYKDVNGVAGEQRLMLPASDSYLEIVTPAGDPVFDGSARAGTNGYFPRHLNNTGGECYPTNTAIPEANCPDAGHINPANGNIWLTMTDAVAYGDRLNLDVTRHYNSAYSQLDSPFGKGWSTPFLLDYNSLYDPLTNSRSVTAVTVSQYLMGLDVIFAPRGVVTFTTPTGSRHQFVQESIDENREILRALTMPGWTLSRVNTLDNWTLAQDNGLVFTFDRAGRLIKYGYPQYGRVISIAYPRTNLNGASELGETPVIITDHQGDFAPRQLELYYDSTHHITKTILRDMTIGADESTCLLADNCVQTTYTYQNGFLTSVTYADGQTAKYAYDEAGRLISLDDPRAPISQRMNFTYNELGEAIGSEVVVGDANTVYELSNPVISGNTRTNTITDRLQNTITYTYSLSAGDLREVGTSYQLTQKTSPLAGTGDRLEDQPFVYRWGEGLQAGFLVRIEARVSTANQGRASRDYIYTPNGQLQCIACAFSSLPALEITYDQVLERRADIFRPTNVAYADGTTEQFAYDANGLLIRYIDRDGAEYNLAWSETAPHSLTRMTRANDGMVWEYFYNPVGLVVSMVQTAPNDTLPYQVSYQWDGLGRLIGLTDGVLGRYAIEYPAATADENGIVTSQIRVIDPVGSATVSTFNGRGQLINTTVEQNEAVIQATAYEYDALGREIARHEQVDDETVYTTQTAYLPTINIGNPDATEQLIRGERVVITDPYGRVTTTIYDALGRIRRTIDTNGIINDYTYNANDVDNDTLQFGLQITQQTALQGTPFTSRADYFFDARRQLRSVRVSSDDAPDTAPIFQEWTFAMNGDTTRLRLLNTSVDSRAFGLREVTWGDYVSGTAPSVSLSHANIPLNSTFNIETNHRATLGAITDFLGRTNRVNNAVDGLEIVYCPIATGGTKALYGTAPACEGDNYDLSLSYDVHGRLIEAINADGRRIITYTPNIALGVWDVTIAFSSNTGEATWALQFNPLGAVTSWTDQNAVVRAYEYDLLGRLVATRVADNPEATTTFRYNAADQLTERADGLGRGFLYNYDVAGRVVSKVDLKTADAISYSYTPNGLLSAITASDGSTTVYVYEDRSQPNRLTRIIEPTGAQHRFEWSDANPNDLLVVNALIYTDPFNNRTVYRYDGTGLLWRVDEPLPRSSEILYDDAGNITDWLRDSINANTVASRITITRPAPTAWTITDTTPNGTGWSRNLGFVNNRLATLGNIRFGYDALGRLVSASNDDDLAWSLGWGNQSSVSVTDAIGGNATLRYDALFRLVSQEVGGEALNYAYTVGDAQIPTMTVNHPTFGTREYVFSAGNARTGESPTVFLRAFGQETAYIYDGEGRLNEIITRVCSDVTYENLFDCITDGVPLYETHAIITYNAVGLPIRISDPDGALETFAYDDVGRLIAYQNADGRNFAYVYDSAGRLNTLTTATGIKLILRYNALDNLTGICRTRASASNIYDDCVGAGGELETYTYDALARLTGRNYDQTTTRYAYDDAGNLINVGDVTYDYDDLGLLSGMSISGGAEYAFTYADLNRIATAGDITLTYDNLGGVLGQNDRVTNATFGYDLAAQTYSITDGSSQLGYVLDGRGFLSALSFNDSALLTMDYLSLQSAVDVLWRDDTLVAYSLNNQRETDNLLFSGANEMSIYYDLSGTGKTLRQNIILPFAGGGYVAIYGYDADERPLTMRITDFQGFTVLFAQSITYNALGLRESEAWQYADSTQVITRYVYDGERLIERRVNVLGDNPQAWTFAYQYDPDGNIASITETTTETTCATLFYDGAGRLLRIDAPETQTNLLYDAYGRLIRMNDTRLSYQGADESPYALLVNNAPVYFGAVEGQPVQFQVGRGGDVTWMINDGRSRALLPYEADTDPSSNVWLFDALGRYVPIVTPAFENPCNLNGAPPNLTENLAVQPLTDGALWLANAGFYIQNGRAYEMETGVYVQRAPYMDALGNIYEAGEANIAPFPVTETSATSNGLRLLRDAMVAGDLNRSLSATSILSAYVPQIDGHESALALDFARARQPLSDTLTDLLALPNWLATQYNLPSAYRDEDGYLRLPVQDAPAQGGYAGEFIMPFNAQMPRWDALVMTAIQPTQSVLARLMDDLRPVTAISSYQPMTHTPLLVQSWQVTDNEPVSTAGDVLAWLPTPLRNPEQGAFALDFADGLANIHSQSDAEWISDVLKDHLPALPALPPINLADWRAELFRDDVFNPASDYGDVLPALPNLPAFRWGVNEDWLGVGR